MTTPPPFNGPLPPQPWQADTAAFYRDVARHQDRRRRWPWVAAACAAAGERGTIIIAWWDSELGRRRWVVGEVGIDGIVADTPYRVVDGALVEVES